MVQRALFVYYMWDPLLTNQLAPFELTKPDPKLLSFAGYPSMRAPVVQLCIFYFGLWSLLSLAYARWITDIMGAIKSADQWTVRFK